MIVLPDMCHVSVVYWGFGGINVFFLISDLMWNYIFFYSEVSHTSTYAFHTIITIIQLFMWPEVFRLSHGRNSFSGPLHDVIWVDETRKKCSHFTVVIHSEKKFFLAKQYEKKEGPYHTGIISINRVLLENYKYF